MHYYTPDVASAIGFYPGMPGPLLPDPGLAALTDQLAQGFNGALQQAYTATGAYTADVYSAFNAGDFGDDKAGERHSCDIGIFGPNDGRGGTHVIVGPNTPAAAIPEPADGQLVHRIASDRVFFVMRAIGDEHEVADLLGRLALYNHGAESGFVDHRW
jgi:hypothetical protein